MTIVQRTFEETIKDRIVERTGGKIELLQVKAESDRVVIRGCVPSYYLKQLALQGARDALGAGNATPIDLHIEVSSSP